jgi:hypothetical protein
LVANSLTDDVIGGGGILKGERGKRFRKKYGRRKKKDFAKIEVKVAENEGIKG